MQLKNQTIFMLGLMRFDNPIESTNFTIARQLARHNRVFYVDNPYTYKDYLRGIGTPAFRRRYGHAARASNGVVDTDQPNLKVIITPPVPSINWMPEGKVYRKALHSAEKLICRSITAVAKQAGISDYIFINSFNFYYPNVGRMLPARLSVYHCVDPLVHPYELRHGRLSEDHVAQQSDLVICTSRRLADELLLLNSNTVLIPNAANLAHSQKALDESLPVHPLLAGIPRPVIGYFGAIERRMDYDLLQAVIDRNRDKSFVFAGPVSEEFIPEWFQKDPNVFLPGLIPYAELPQMLKGFDVAVIPFKKDEASASIFPLKLFEYLGAGLPVVATDFNPDLKRYTYDSVDYCGTALSFSDALNAPLMADDSLRNARLAIAAENTWERRAGEFAAAICRTLKEKKSRQADLLTPLCPF